MVRLFRILIFFSLSFNKKISTGVYYIKEINNEGD